MSLSTPDCKMIFCTRELCCRLNNWWAICDWSRQSSEWWRYDDMIANIDKPERIYTMLCWYALMSWTENVFYKMTMSPFSHTLPHLGSLHKKESELYFSPLQSTEGRLCECHHTFLLSFFFPSLLHHYVWAYSRDCLVFPNHPQEFPN